MNIDDLKLIQQQYKLGLDIGDDLMMLSEYIQSLQAELSALKEGVVAEFEASLTMGTEMMGTSKIVIHDSDIDFAFNGSSLGGKKYKVTISEVKE